MQKELQIYLIWLILIIVWNFGYPAALPIYDVIISIILAFLIKLLNNYKI